jgi:hypothetical protein
MCDPKAMCRQRLLSEYRELFAIVGTLNRKTSIASYIRNNLIEPESIRERWKELRKEILARGYRPRKPLPDYGLSHLPEYIRRYRIVRSDSPRALLDRCPDCRSNLEYPRKETCI